MEALTLLTLVLDTLTGLALLWLAYSALASPQLFKGVVFFITFGLVMALVWLRLNAPDIALAEAAIGAGITGALLLAALARLPSPGVQQDGLDQPGKQREAGRKSQWLCAFLLCLIAVVLAYSIASISPNAADLSSLVAANLEKSGVSNPVTAILLNFRGYDTLIEMLVLLLVLMGVWSLGDLPPQSTAPVSLVLNTLMRVLTPVLILLAAYLLWLGAHAYGGAFQAGAVLGSAGVLLLLAGWRPHSQLPLRLVLVMGPGFFVVTALLTISIGQDLLEYPPGSAGILIFILEITAAVSIGTTLAALFLRESQPNESQS